MEKPEIILNLWYVCDDMGVIYSLRGRAYLGWGTDEEKMSFLQKFAQTDYLIARGFPIPSRFHMHGLAVTHKRILDLEGMPGDLFREVFKALNDELPVQTPYDIPQKPLICLTPLIGNDRNEIRPFFTEEGHI